MLQALAPHLPIAPPQSLYLAITQLQHGSCIFQFQCPTVDSPHYPHPLQLTAAHARPHSTRPPVAGGLSLRGHFYSVREGTLSKSFNTLMLTVTPPHRVCLLAVLVRLLLPSRFLLLPATGRVGGNRY